MAGSNKEKYIKDQRRKTKYVQESDDEQAGSYEKAEHPVRSTLAKPKDESAVSASASSERREKTRKGKPSDKPQGVQAETKALEPKSVEALRKKARNKQRGCSSLMTELELIQAFKK